MHHETLASGLCRRVKSGKWFAVTPGRKPHNAGFEKMERRGSRIDQPTYREAAGAPNVAPKAQAGPNLVLSNIGAPFGQRA